MHDPERPEPLFIDMFMNSFNEEGRQAAADSALGRAAGREFGGCCSGPFHLKLDDDDQLVVVPLDFEEVKAAEEAEKEREEEERVEEERAARERAEGERALPTVRHRRSAFHLSLATVSFGWPFTVRHSIFRSIGTVSLTFGWPFCCGQDCVFCMAGESSELGKLLRFELPEGQVLFAHQHCASWGQNLIHVGRNPVRNKTPSFRTLFPLTETTKERKKLSKAPAAAELGKH